MRSILSQIINSKIESHNNYSIKKWHIRSYWQFYQAFCISCSVLGIKLSKKDLNRRSLLYKKLILKRTMADREFNLINDLINKDFKIIFDALDHLNKISEQDTKFSVGKDKDKYVAILASEVEWEL